MSPVDDALAALRRGGLVAIPTETVYGLAADASSAPAVRRIFAAKGRPADHPLIVHVGSAAELAHWASTVPPAAARLASTCWPGPLTVLVPKAEHVLSVVTGGRDTVGVRVPAHPLALELLARFGGGLAAPSANHFGHVSPTTADHVRRDLGALVEVILDGGPCPIGVESTIVDCTTNPAQILRPGGIPDEQISALLDGDLADASGPSRAAGMLAAHYAPACRVELAASRAEAERLAAAAVELGERADVIDGTADLAVYARSLYGWLRDADDRSLDLVVAVLPPPAGLGHAIRDRLTKAAAAVVRATRGRGG
ncbi:MAG: L-threonylcarbamoyladenylate synthase [Ilumatobacteraceae bacterium]